MNKGILITIVIVEEKQVVSMRKGYPYPCMRSMYKLLAKSSECPKTVF
ncbi:TPA: DUF4222 domain-containing protein [Escherichia coli]|nr:DUF4222 domain-containing protein [Escherichia coli]